MILTSNRGFAERSEVVGDPVVATALLDRPLHHAAVVQIEGASYRLPVRKHTRTHADIPPPAPKRRGCPPKDGGAHHMPGLSPNPRGGEFCASTSGESSSSIYRPGGSGVLRPCDLSGAGSIRKARSAIAIC